MKKRLVAFLSIFIMACSFMFAGEWDISVFRPAVNPRNKKDIMVKAAEKYKKETGGKVTFIMGDWGNWQSKVLTNMAAGTPIDVVFARDSDFPKFYIKGYLQPLENYVDLKGLKGFDGAKLISDFNEEKVFKYDGHYYAASQYTSNHCWIVMYNKSLMEEEGIKEEDQPLALYRKGLWDWNHLEVLANKLTKDTSGSGSIDRWGFGNWYTRAFIWMNGGELTKTDESGKQQLNFTDSKVIEALSFLEKAKTSGWYQQDNSICKEGIQNRTIAMLMEREYYPSTFISKTDDEICYVPLPHGPAVTEAPNVFECDGYGIGNGSAKQKAAGKFIEYALNEWYIEDIRTRKETWPEEALELSLEMAKKNVIYPGPSVSALDSILEDFLGEIIWTGNSPAAAIEKFTPKATAYIADANKPMGKLERLPFKPVSMNFDKMKDKQLSDIFVPWSETPSAEFKIVKGSEAISKQSLKASFKPEDGETGAILTLTNREKLGVVGWRSYKVSFKVKMAGEKTADNPIVWMKAYDDEINNYGYVSKIMEDNSTVYEVSGVFNDVNQNGKLGIMIGINGCTSVIIDDLEITEKE